jgi:UDP-N-acetylglucosamine 4,6-dehydratase
VLNVRETKNRTCSDLESVNEVIFLNSLFDGKTILVTGGTGSIGSEIVRQLLGYKVKKVIVYGIDEIENFTMSQRIRDERLDIIMGDVRDYQYLSNVFIHYKIDLIYHAAALKHVVMCEKSPIEPVKTNIIGTQNVLDLALHYKVLKTILISTDKAVYPTSVMGATKFIAERLVFNANDWAETGQFFSCVRFGNVANSRGSVIPTFCNCLFNNLPIKVTDPEVTRFTIKIEDAVSLIFKATSQMHGGEIFILKMKAFRLGDLVDAIQRVSRRYKVVMPDVIYTGLEAGEKLHEDLINKLEQYYLYEDLNMYVVDPSRKIVAKGKEKKIEPITYSSNDVGRLSVTDLEKLIIDYINLNKICS